MDDNKVKEARKYRIYPNQAQEEQIKLTINACREMWNHLLAYAYQPVQELDEIKNAPDRKRSKMMYDYLKGHLEIIKQDDGTDAKQQWQYSYKNVAKIVGVKEKWLKELVESDDNKKININGYEIKKVGMLYEDLKDLVKRLNKISPKMIKNEYPRLKMVDSAALMYAKRQLKTAFDSFFKNPGYFGLPTFKSYKSTLYQGSYTTSGGNKMMAYIKDDKHLKLGKTKGLVKFVNHYPVSGDARLYKVTIRRTPSNEYFATLHYEMDEHTHSSSKTGNKVGIDMNIAKNGLATDQGAIIKPSDITELDKRLQREKRKLSRRQHNAIEQIQFDKEEHKKNELYHVRNLTEFGRYQKQRLKVARLQERINNKKFDFEKKITTQIVDNNDLIAIEDLSSKNMTQKGKGKGAKAKRKLNKDILGMSFYALRAKMEYKAEWSGKQVVAVDPAYTSKTCFECGNINNSLTTEREWTCPHCGTHLIRDVNAAQNILKKALK